MKGNKLTETEKYIRDIPEDDKSGTKKKDITDIIARPELFVIVGLGYLLVSSLATLDPVMQAADSLITPVSPVSGSL